MAQLQAPQGFCIDWLPSSAYAREMCLFSPDKTYVTDVLAPAVNTGQVDLVHTFQGKAGRKCRQSATKAAQRC